MSSETITETTSIPVASSTEPACETMEKEDTTKTKMNNTRKLRWAVTATFAIGVVVFIAVAVSQFGSSSVVSQSTSNSTHSVVSEEEQQPHEQFRPPNPDFGNYFIPRHSPTNSPTNTNNNNNANGQLLLISTNQPTARSTNPIITGTQTTILSTNPPTIRPTRPSIDETITTYRPTNPPTIKQPTITYRPTHRPTNRLTSVLNSGQTQLSSPPINANPSTLKPTQKPTAPCAVNLPSNFTALTVVNLQFQPVEEEVDANFVIDQMREIFQSTYNRIANVKYTPCDEAYRQVQSVKQVDISQGAELEDDEVVSFVFRRNLEEKAEAAIREKISSSITTHHVRIGRRLEDVENEDFEDDTNTWISVSLLFEASVACQGMYCLGDNSELFGPVIINKDGFSKTYAENVARSLLWKPATSSTNSTNSSTPVEFSTTVKVETVREIEEQSCPVVNDLVEFSRTVIVELIQDSSSEPLLYPWDSRFDAINEAYVESYNKLIRNEFCDPFFRRLTGAEVVDIGKTSPTASKNGTTATILPLEIRLYGECKGCDPNAIDIYEAPSVLVGPTSSSSSNARYLVGSSSSNDDKWRLPFPTNERNLEEEAGQNTFDDKCYCDAQPFGNRAPFESEFVSQFQKAVQFLKLEDFSSVHKCRFGTTFSTGIWMSVTIEEGATKDVLETTLKNSLNELLAVTPTTCNKDFRVIEKVELVSGTNITRDQQSLQIPSKNATNAEIQKSSDASIAMLNGGLRRLSNYQWDRPTIRILNETEKAAINCFDPAASNILTIVGCCEHQKEESVSVANNTLQCYDTPEVITPAPTYSPFDPTALSGGSSVPLLFLVSGICSGCDDSLLTGLSNDVVRMLSKKAPTSLESSHGSDSKASRRLEDENVVEDQKAKSDCFCPINSTVSTGDIDAYELSLLFQEYLENEDIEGVFEILDEVDVVECDDVENEFFTTATITVAGDLDDSDVEWLAYAFMETYNYLNPLYCDPYFRKVSDVEEVFWWQNNKKRKTRNLAGNCIETEIEFHLRGTCIGCEDGHPLFDDPDWFQNYDDDWYDGRKRNLKSLFDSHKLSTVHNPEPHRHSRRRLQKSDVCYCVGDTLADRAPSFDEFFFVFQEEVRFAPNVCKLLDIFMSDGDYVPADDDDYYNHDDHYENFFLRTHDETIPPEYYIDTDQPVGEETSNPSEEEETSNPSEEEETSNPSEEEGTSDPEAEEGTSDPEAEEGTYDPEAEEGTSDPEAEEGTYDPEAEEGTYDPEAEEWEEIFDPDVLRDGSNDDGFNEVGWLDDAMYDDGWHDDEWQDDGGHDDHDDGWEDDEWQDDGGHDDHDDGWEDDGEHEDWSDDGGHDDGWRN